MGDVSLERESDVDVSEERGGVVSMDTPERKQINTPVSKFEDSPVFNYLNNLSPIQPVKSVHITQTFNSLSFASLPSVFTSPHVSTIKESRFLRRHQLSDPSKFELTSENANKVGKQEEVVGIDHDSNEHQNFGKGSAAAEPPYDSNPSNELSRTLNNKSVSPDSDPTACSVMETKCIPELIGSSSSLVPSVHIDSESFQVGSEFNIGEVSHIDQNKEVSGCDWEDLLSVEADLSIFESPADLKSLKDPSQKPLKPGASFCTSLSDGLQNSGATQAVGPSQRSETDNMSSQHKESGNMMEIAENHDLLVSLSNCEAGDTNDIVDDEFASNMHRGLRRRCLVFEMAGSRRQPLNDVSNIGLGPSTLSHSYDNISSNDECLVPIKPGHDIPRCIQHGIGLHLNALASTSVNHKIVKHKALNTDRQPISAFPLAVCLNSSNRQEITKNSVVASSSERDMLPVGDDMSLVEDAVHASEDVVDEVFDHSSPKKKRCKSESGGESEACKRCNCKKSKCLKLYCECFAAGVYCVEPCACQECFNKPIHEDTVLAARMQIESRNPLAFAPKVIRSSESVIETGEESRKTPASARHKRGCNCKKSGCTKKYCECYQGGVGCSINCRCERCKNAFGRKDGSTSKGIEVELDEEKEADTCRSVIDKSLQITTVQNDAEQNTNFALPETPLQFGRQLIELPLSSRNKRPPRATFLAIGSSSQKFKKLNPPQAKFEKHITVREDEMPEILRSPISVVKSVSPNSKRVSPPHCNTGFTSGLRSSRKLILQSIPSFPSLTPKQ